MDVGPQPPVEHNVFANPDLLVRLLVSETEVGYKLVTFYTACATLYVAIVGLTVQQYFTALSERAARADGIAWFGLALSILSLTAPLGLRHCKQEIETRAARYAAALGLPEERFTVVGFGGWLSLFLFSMITIGWTYLISIS